MKILLFGRNGQVGWELQRSLATMGDVVLLGRDAIANPDGMCGDLTDLDGLARTVRQAAPAVIVNAAAYTAVERAESEPGLAHTVNALAPGVLASEANQLGAWLVHFSTDYVFDGSGNAPWRESDRTGPLNVYGRSKLDGESAVAAATRHLILRTSWVYAARGGNFAKTMLALAREKSSFSVVDDQFGAPTAAETVADATTCLLRQAIARPELAGLYHCAAGGETSWHGYAQFVVAQALAMGWEIAARPETILAVSTAEKASAARRPLNSRLDTTRIRSTFQLHLPHWQLLLRRMLEEITSRKAP